MSLLMTSVEGMRKYLVDEIIEEMHVQEALGVLHWIGFGVQDPIDPKAPPVEPDVDTNPNIIIVPGLAFEGHTRFEIAFYGAKQMLGEKYTNECFSFLGSGYKKELLDRLPC